MMEFSEFAKKLMPIIGNGASQADFARTLFENMVDADGSRILDDCSDESFKKYYTGKTGIGSIARKLGSSLDPEVFASYIEEKQDSVAQRIVDEFSDCIDGIDKLNVGEMMASLFGSIISQASQDTGRRKLNDKAKDDVQAECIYEAEPEGGTEKATPVNQNVIIQNGDNCSVINSSGTVNINL